MVSGGLLGGPLVLKKTSFVGLLLFLWVVIVPMLLESDKLAKCSLESLQRGGK